jgi:Gpi18-like mannosyltransferase
MLLGNEEIREFNQYLFNDSLLALHVMLALYFLLVRNKPVIASFFLTLSISIKAGAILMIPTFMGWIMYLHGLVVLVKCFTVVLTVQFLLMAPLCFDPFAKLFGFPAGMTYYMDYLKYAKFIEDKERKYGAT